MNLKQKYAQLCLNDIGVQTDVIDGTLFEIQGDQKFQVLPIEDLARSWAIGMQNRPLNVLIACERSHTFRKAFEDLGHHAVSVDILTDEEGSDYHYCGDAITFVLDNEGKNPNTGDYFDLMIATPPSDYIDSSETRWFDMNKKRQADALGFIYELLSLPIPHKCLLLPSTIINTQNLIQSSQVINPKAFQDNYGKQVYVYTENLPKLSLPQPKQVNSLISKYKTFKNRKDKNLNNLAKEMAAQFTDYLENSILSIV